MTTSTSTTVTVMMEVCKRRKRKNSNLDSDDQSFHPDSHLLFRKHFEATFQPLPEQQPQLSSVGENEEDSTDEAAISDWEGLSDVEQAEEVAYQVTSQTGGVEVSRTEQRAFMVGFNYIYSSVFDGLIVTELESTQISGSQCHEAKHIVCPSCCSKCRG